MGKAKSVPEGGFTFSLGNMGDLLAMREKYHKKPSSEAFGVLLPTEEAVHTENHCFVVAKRKDTKEIVGFAKMDFQKGVIYISSIGVLKEYGGLLGKDLLTHAEALGRKRLEQLGGVFAGFTLMPSGSVLRGKEKRTKFLFKEDTAGRTPRKIRVRWFRQAGYSPLEKGSVVLIKRK